MYMRRLILEDIQPDESSHCTLTITRGVFDCWLYLMQIKTDNNPKALDVLTGFLHFLEQFHHKVFTMVSSLLQLCTNAIWVNACEAEV